MLEDGYFVCVKKAGLAQTEILTALLADGACFEGNVGKLSCLQGATMPIEIPLSPAFIAKDSDGFVITPGGWMPYCPVLYGAEGLLPNQQELLECGGLQEDCHILTTQEIVESAESAKVFINEATAKTGKRWMHLAKISCKYHLSDQERQDLFAIFAIPEKEHHEYVIYMINSLHGAASAALNEIMISTEKKMKLNLMQTVAPYCQAVNTNDLQATLIPYYSKYSVGARHQEKKAYTVPIHDLSSQALAVFTDLGELTVFPELSFMANICASDIYKMFPGGIHGVHNRRDMLELYRALALGVPGSTMSATGLMDPMKFNMQPTKDPTEISKPGTDLATFICLATLYTARMPDGGQLRDCEPRHLHIMNMLERMRTIKNERLTSADGQEDSQILWWLRTLIDDVHAATLLTYMDSAAAIHKLDYENLSIGKPDERKGLRSFASKTYQRPLVSIPKAGPLVRLWVATGGDAPMYAAIIRAAERDVWRWRDDAGLVTEASMATQLSCSCPNKRVCVHRIINDWCHLAQFRTSTPDSGTMPGQMQNVASASQGMQKRPYRKRSAAGKVKEPEKMPHDSMFVGTLRCASAYDIMCSPVGNAMLKPHDGRPAQMYETEKGNDATETYKNHRFLSSVINSIVKKASMGVEEEDGNALYQNGMPYGDIAVKNTMAKIGSLKLQALMFMSSPQVLFENGRASWEPGCRAPVYAKLPDGRRGISAQAEMAIVIKRAANAFLRKTIGILRLARRECSEIQNKATSPLVTDAMWKSTLRCDPNLNQYDGMNAPLMTATMINILRPVITAQKAQGMLFPQAGFAKNSFPAFDRTKLDNVFGNGANVQYGMDGSFLAQQPQIAVFTHSDPPKCVPCLWQGSFNERMTINTCRIKGICKGNDVPSKWNTTAAKKGSRQTTPGAGETTQLQQKQSTEEIDVEEGPYLRELRKVLSSPFLFDKDAVDDDDDDDDDNDDDDMAYTDKLEEMKDVPPQQQSLSQWMSGAVVMGLIDILKNPSHTAIVSTAARKVLHGLPKWRYVSQILDLMNSAYGPCGYFIKGDQGLSTFKYLLAYIMTCRTFNVATFHSKPTFTMCAFVGECQKRLGRRTDYLLNYDLLFAQDAPYLTTPMDYVLYGSSLQTKVFGGACMKRVIDSDTNILAGIGKRICNSRFNGPLFILMTPCVPFPDRNSEGRSLAMLSLLSFQEILIQLESENTANVIARTCGYDNLRCAAGAELSDLVSKLSCLSISTKEAEIIARLLKDMVATSVHQSTSEGDMPISWGDEYELVANEPNEEMDMLHSVEDIMTEYS